MAESSGEGDKEVGSDQGQGQQDLSSVPFPEDCGAKRAAGQANSKEEDLGTGRPQKNLQHYSWARGSYNSKACGREGLPVSISLVEVSVCDILSRQALKVKAVTQIKEQHSVFYASKEETFFWGISQFLNIFPVCMLTTYMCINCCAFGQDPKVFCCFFFKIITT